MAEMYAVSGETLTGIADAIRSKTGSDDFMTVASMASAIEGISGGGISIPSDFGLSKMWMGTLTVDIPTTTPRIAHGLGEVPKVFFLWLDEEWEYNAAPGDKNYLFAMFYLNPSQTEGKDNMTVGKLINGGGFPQLKFGNTYDGKIYAYADRIALNVSSTSIFSGKYNMIAMA